MAGGTRIYLNNVSTKLTSALAAAGTTANVTAGEGALFAAAASPNWIIATLSKMSGYREVAREIIKITARSTDALTIARAQEGTTALDFAVGDVLDVRSTAAAFDALQAFKGSFTRDLTTATGTQAITGVGFKPKAIIIFGSVASGNLVAAMMDDGLREGGTSGVAAAMFTSTTSFIVYVDATNYQAATLASMDADGFTLSWTKVLSPTGTFTANFLALR